MNTVQSIQALNQRELELGLVDKASWHYEFKDSAYIFVSGLHPGLTEGDILAIFSQYGEILDLNLVKTKSEGRERERERGGSGRREESATEGAPRSRGFAFLMYQDWNSTILAVDNMNGVKVLDKVLAVNHVRDYRPPERADGSQGPSRNVAPKPLERRKGGRRHDADERKERLAIEAGLDMEDPMAEYLLEKYKKKKKEERRRTAEKTSH